MNWQAVAAIAASCVAVAGLANYLLLNQIRIAILQQTDQLKTWAMTEFATEKETERRLSALESARAHR